MMLNLRHIFRYTIAALWLFGIWNTGLHTIYQTHVLCDTHNKFEHANENSHLEQANSYSLDSGVVFPNIVAAAQEYQHDICIDTISAKQKAYISGSFAYLYSSCEAKYRTRQVVRDISNRTLFRLSPSLSPPLA